MIERYKSFLAEFDKKLEEYFLSQKEHIRCRPGCSGCCEAGEYPMSRLEMEYIMNAFMHLPLETQIKIKENIAAARGKKEYRCPFLLEDGLCAVYEQRGLVCRTHGLAYLCGEAVKLPECACEGLSYSDVFDTETNILSAEPLKTSLRTDDILCSPLAKSFSLEPEVIRPLIDWLTA